MATSYLNLVNKLRDRFNEVHLTTSNWSTVVGFDQFSKDAINYAMHDILNAEMEWPFLHQDGNLTTTPGIQFYIISPNAPTGFTNPAEIKTIDWDSFYINTNQTETTITHEAHTIPSVTPYSIAVTNVASWNTDLGVIFTIGSVALTAVSGDPEQGQYTINNGTYLFNSGDIAKAVQISYQTVSQTTEAVNITAQKLPYMDYDYWRTNFLSADFNSITKDYAQPTNVFKPQQYAQIGFTPVPDKIYVASYEYWLDGADLNLTTDVSLIPSRFEQIILDGAQKYCYEFREDPQQAALADNRFKAGIARMRIELINRNSTMNAGIHWYQRGYTWAGPTF